MKTLIIALAAAVIAPVAIAQDTGVASASSVNRMDVGSISTVSGSFNTHLSTQGNSQSASANARTSGREGIAISDSSNLFIDRQIDTVIGDYNTVVADDYVRQDARSAAFGHAWGAPAEALTINELASTDDRFVEGYGNLDLRDTRNTQFGSSTATGAPVSPPRRFPVCTPTGICR